MKFLPLTSQLLRPKGSQVTTAPCLEDPEVQDESLIFDNFKSEWLTTPQAATYLGISEGALRNLTSVGRVPYCKLGRRNRYLVADLRALLLNERRGPNGDKT